ncbi:MAG TPA: hypothetical protein VFO83_08620 [Aggregicoccus sp.]|nr:hypothetical protein [Aggregicoccus sp.]
MSVTDALALLLSGAGVGAALLGAAARRPHAGLAMMLDLWVAAALLRLTGVLDWQRVIAAALLVAARRLIMQPLLRRRLRARLH